MSQRRRSARPFGNKCGVNAKPNFSGVWKFDPKKSKLQILAPASSAFVVDHKEPDFHLSRTHIYDGKPDIWNISLTTDGKEVVQKEVGWTLRTRLYWQGNRLILDSKIVLSDGKASNVVRYQLSEDGKSFVALEAFKGPRYKYDNIWVFEKEKQNRP